MDRSAHDDSWADGSGFAVAVALASVLALDPGGWFPFSIAKWAAVLVCALVAAAHTVWLGLPRVERGTAAAWTILLVTVVLSTLVGLDGSIAWIGTPVRHLGALTWIVFAMLFVVGLGVGNRQRLLRGMTIVGGLLGLYTLWEIALGAPVAYVSNSSRAGGPYGSAAYLGAACCLFLPIAAGIAGSAVQDTARSAERRWRIGGVLTAALLVFAVVGSGTRGAALALAVVGASVAVLRARSATHRWLAAAVAGVLLFVCGVAAIVTDLFERSSPVGSRLDEWRLGVAALRDRPLRGFGPEGYRLVVDRFMSADYVRTYGDAVLPDRAHNAVLDVALSSGIVAAVAYVVLLGIVVRAGVRLVRLGSAEQGGLGSAAIAFVIQQQFLFPIAEIDAVFWIVAGTTVASARLPGMPSAGTSWRVAIGVRRSVAVALGIAALVAATAGVRSVAADRLARSATESRNADQSISNAQRAVDLDPTDIRLPVLLARSSERQQTLNGVDGAIEALGSAQTISPLDPTVRREAARLASLRAAITGMADDRQDAIARWERLVDDAPNCASCQRGLGLTLLEADQRARAIDVLRSAAALADDAAIAVLDELLVDR